MYLYDAYRSPVSRLPAMPRTPPPIRPYQLPPQPADPFTPTDPWGRTPSSPGFSLSTATAIMLIGQYDYWAIRQIMEMWPQGIVRPYSSGGLTLNHTCAGGAGGHVFAGFAPGCPTIVSGAAWRQGPSPVASIAATFVKFLPFDQVQIITNFVYAGISGTALPRNAAVLQLPQTASLPDTRTDGKWGFPNTPETPTTTSPATQRPRRRDRERKLSAGSAVGAVVLTLGAIGAVNSLIGAFYRSLPARDRRGGRLGAAAQLNRVLEHWQDINSAKLAQNLLSRAMMMRLAGAAFGAAYKVDPYVGFGLNNAINQQDHIVAVHEYHG